MPRASKRVRERANNEPAHQSRVTEAHFRFRRMHVHIHHSRIQVNEQYIHRKTIGSDHLLVRIHHGVIEIGALDKPVINKKVLIASCFFSRFRFANKPVNVHVIGFLFYRYQFGIVVIPQQLNNTLLQASRFQVKNFLAIAGKGKENMRK